MDSRNKMLDKYASMRKISNAVFSTFSVNRNTAAILVAHGTQPMCFRGDSWGPKGRNSRPKAESWGQWSGKFGGDWKNRRKQSEGSLETEVFG